MPRKKTVAPETPAAPSMKPQGPDSWAKLTINLRQRVADAARDCVLFLEGDPDERMTLSRLATDALDREIERLAKKHNGGRPFPRRHTAATRGEGVAPGLRAGRRIGR